MATQDEQCLPHLPRIGLTSHFLHRTTRRKPMSNLSTRETILFAEVTQHNSIYLCLSWLGELPECGFNFAKCRVGKVEISFLTILGPQLDPSNSWNGHTPQQTKFNGKNQKVAPNVSWSRYFHTKMLKMSWGFHWTSIGLSLSFLQYSTAQFCSIRFLCVYYW